MANNHMKDAQKNASVGIEIQMRTMVRYHCTPIEMAKLKRLTISSSGEGTEQWDLNHESEIMWLLSINSYFGRVQYYRIMVNLMSGI